MEREETMQDRVEVTLMRKAELLALLGVGEWTLRNWIEQQGFPQPVYIKNGSPARWRASQVRRWLDARERRRRRPIKRGKLMRGSTPGA